MSDMVQPLPGGPAAQDAHTNMIAMQPLLTGPGIMYAEIILQYQLWRRLLPRMHTSRHFDAPPAKWHLVQNTIPC